MGELKSIGAAAKISFMTDYTMRHCAAAGIDPAPFLNPDEQPEPAVCPHCGALLAYPLAVEGMPQLGWRPIPEPCENPHCQEIERKAREAQERRERMAALREQIERSGVPADYRGKSTQNFETPTPVLARAKDAVYAYAQGIEANFHEGTGLYIAGPPGTGKTHLAVAALRGALWAGHTALFTTSLGLMRQIKDEFDGDGVFVRRCRNVGLLVIDDIGKENATPWALSQLCDIIGERYASRRPTVYTSNYRLAELTQAIAGREGTDSATAIVSRITGATRTVPCIGKDWRRTA